MHIITCMFLFYDHYYYSNWDWKVFDTFYAWKWNTRSPIIKSCEEEPCFVRRFRSLADLEMEDIDIPIVTRCVPGQQGVKQPIKWKQQHFGPLHTVNNNLRSQIRKFKGWLLNFCFPWVSSQQNKTLFFPPRSLSAFISVASSVFSSPSLIVSLHPSRWVRRCRRLGR